jgi:hypothetical protein
VAAPRNVEPLTGKLKLAQCVNYSQKGFE